MFGRSQITLELRSILDAQEDHILRYLRDTTLTFVNAAFARSVGLARDALIGRPLVELLDEPHGKQTRDHIAEMLRTRRSVRYVRQRRSRDGALACESWEDRPIIEPDGRILQFQSVCRDVTGAALEAQELRVGSEAFDSLSRVARIFGAGGTIEAAAAQLLRTVIEQAGCTSGLLCAAEDDARMRVLASAGLDDLAQGLGRLNVDTTEPPSGGRVSRVDAAELSALVDQQAAPGCRTVAAAPVRGGGEVIGFLVVGGAAAELPERVHAYVDTMAQHAAPYCALFRRGLLSDRMVDERRVVDESLRLTNERVEELTLTLEDVIWIYDVAQRRVEYVSPAYGRIWGCDPAAILAGELDDISRAVLPEFRAALRSAFLASLETGRLECTYQIRRGDGQVRWILDRGFPIRDAGGRIVRMAGIAKDITDQKAATDRLIESERLLQASLDALPAHIAILDSSGVIVAVNRRWSEFLEASGQPPEGGAIGADYLRLLGRILCDDAAAEHPIRQAILDVLHAPLAEFQTEFATTAARQRRWYELHFVRIASQGLGTAVATHLDISARRLAEQRARERQAELAHMGRVTTTGELAAGIAHELNQPLSSIANYAEGCLDRLSESGRAPEDVHSALERIRSLAHSSGKIIQRIRSITRRSEPRRSTLAVNELIGDVLQMFEFDSERAGLHIRPNLAEGLPAVYADAILVQQVVTNLLLNAIAFAKKTRTSSPHVSISTRLSRDAIEVSVTDNGPGFDCSPETLFEPFFSTKQDGLGLGLAISQSIVRDHGGEIVASRAGDVTSFTFTLPLPAAGDRKQEVVP